MKEDVGTSKPKKHANKVGSSLATRPFASAFTLGRGRGNVWRLLTQFYGQ